MQISSIRHQLDEVKMAARLLLRIANGYSEVLDGVRADTQVAISDQAPLVDALDLVKEGHVEMQKIAPLVDRFRRDRERGLRV